MSESHSFFLFGPRGSGKSTLLRERFVSQKTFYVDLLEAGPESRYSRNPDLLKADISARTTPDWVIIDEVQKVPKLLDIVHQLIEQNKNLKFILTGSSARKLKRNSANLLAGRAFLFYLHPLTATELGTSFDLQMVLQWGSLPKIFSLQSDEDKRNFLNSYIKTYLQEEIFAEQIIRNIGGFRNFLEVAAQMNGKSLNFSKIAREAGVDSKTVKTFYQILEDTLVGFWLPAYHKSVRKAQNQQPKFILFDLGIQRALEGCLESPPVAGTSMYGQYFESFVINEVFRMNSYSQKDFRLSHYRTTTDQEIDLILTKGKKTLLVEIKSSNRTDPMEVAKFARIAEGFRNAEKYFVSHDPVTSLIENVRCMHWSEFLKTIFTI